MPSVEARTRPAFGVAPASFDALGHVFAVQTDDQRLGELVGRSFAALATERAPKGSYAIQRTPDGILEVAWDGRAPVSSRNCAGVLAWLRHDVTRRAVAAADGDLVLHAGCAALGEDAVVVSGAPSTGKSTLVAALLARGLTYIADEAVPLDIVSAKVRAFPGPMALDDHSLDLLPEVIPLRVPRGGAAIRHLIVAGRRGLCPPSPRNVAMVLFPEREGPGEPVLEAVDADAALVKLAEQTFNLPSHVGAAIDVLSRVTAHAPAFRVVGDDPHATADAVLDALASL